MEVADLKFDFWAKLSTNRAISSDTKNAISSSPKYRISASFSHDPHAQPRMLRLGGASREDVGVTSVNDGECGASEELSAGKVLA
jgi:hypothetical protein